MDITDLKPALLILLLDDYCRDYLPDYLDPKAFKLMIMSIQDTAIMLNASYLRRGWYFSVSSLRADETGILTYNVKDPLYVKESLVFLLFNDLVYAYVQKDDSFTSENYVISSFSRAQDLAERINEDHQKSDIDISFKPSDFEKIDAR